MNKILFKLIEGKGKLFLNGDLKNGEIVNPEVLNIDYEEMQESGHSLKDGDTFSMPEGMGFEETQYNFKNAILLLPEKPVQKVQLSKEDQERIENAASDNSDIINHDAFLGFKAGAEYEHPIAYNKALEEVNELITNILSKESYKDDYREEILKLKK